MNVPIKPSDAISAAQPIGRPSFDVFLKTQLAALPADEAVLLPLYAAYRGAAEALQAEFNKPRTTGLAADRLEDEIDRANDYALRHRREIVAAQIGDEAMAWAVPRNDGLPQLLHRRRCDNGRNGNRDGRRAAGQGKIFPLTIALR